MSRPVSVWLALLALSLSGCSAVTDFDRKLIEERKHGMDAGPQVEEDAEAEAGEDEDGGEPDLGCAPGTAGEDCAPCEPGTFCAGGSATKLDCGDGTFDHDLNAASPCVEHSICVAGEFVAGQGSATTNRACAPCAAGRFSTEENSPDCEGWTTCQANQFVAMDGTTESDQVCRDCEDGFFSDAVNSGRCVPYGSCAAGTRRQTPGATTGPCVSCMAGEYCPGEDSPPEPCMASWDHDSNPASRCTDWTSCGAGMFVSTTGTATADRVCSSCTAGTFTSMPNSMACAPWSNCEAGTYVSRAADAAQDRVCMPCADGTFNAAQNATMCVAHRTCDAGTFVGTAGTAVADRVCTACPTGQFSAGDNAASCAAWRVCPAAQYIATAGSASADQVCMPCPSGTYSAAPNTSMCVPQGSCAPGTRQTVAGSGTTPPTCVMCATGQYCAGGAAAPVACGNGTYDHDNNSVTACQPWTDCTPGQFQSTAGSATSNRVCARCSSGFTTGTNATSCTPWSDCAPGRYVQNAGTDRTDRVCANCTTGTFTASANLSSCTAWQPCPAGTYVVPPAASATTNRSCESCATITGTFTASTALDPRNRSPNASMCLPWTTCPAGQYVVSAPSQSADRECRDCPMGWSSTEPNQTQCLSADGCSVGQRQTAPPDVATMVPRQCTACTDGWYCPGGSSPGLQCGNGNWDSDPSSFADMCRPWAICPAGTEVSDTAPGTGTSDRACTPCTTGFTAAENQASCTPFTTCIPGQRETVQPLPTRNRSCENCAAGSFSGSNNATTCTLCMPGTSAMNAGSASCAACSMGYAPGMGATMCAPWSPCSASQYQSMAGSATTDRMCTTIRDCTAGSRQTAEPTTTMDRVCGPCPAGQYSDAPINNTAECTPCPAGTSNASIGSSMASACVACGPNEISAAGAPGCTACGANASANSSHTACECNNGFFLSAGTCTAWSTCMPPQYEAAAPTSTTNRMCMNCPPGTTTSGNNQPMSACAAIPAPDGGMMGGTGSVGM